MTRSVYDEPTFFEGYSCLRRSTDGPAGAPEWPSLAALVPDLKGRAVLDLGCGFGWFSRYAAQQGAASVLALDHSEKMLERARAMTAGAAGAAVTYRLADLETLDLPAGSFDVAFSSLALHYLADLESLFRSVRSALTPQGHLVFSMEHPVFTAPAMPCWLVDIHGRNVWALEGYALEGRRTVDWLGGRVTKYHRTLGTILNSLLRAGFVVRHVEEWAPSPAEVAADASLATEWDRPMFLLAAAEVADA